MKINKTYITLIACALINANAQDITDAIKHDNRSSTKIIQTYRFDELLDDGSYKIKIENPKFPNSKIPQFQIPKSAKLTSGGGSACQLASASATATSSSGPLWGPNSNHSTV